MSLVEVVTGSVIAFVVSIWANRAVLPLFGFHVRIEQSFEITLIFTVISIIRSYVVRRFFEIYLRPFTDWLHRAIRGTSSVLWLTRSAGS
jgi:hypothetical protein